MSASRMSPNPKKAKKRNNVPAEWVFDQVQGGLLGDGSGEPPLLFFWGGYALLRGKPPSDGLRALVCKYAYPWRCSGSGASSISSSREASPVACWVPSGEGLAPAAACDAELAAVAASCFFRC